jgi:hypothetical protein
MKRNDGTDISAKEAAKRLVFERGSSVESIINDQDALTEACGLKKLTLKQFHELCRHIEGTINRVRKYLKMD